MNTSQLLNHILIHGGATINPKNLSLYTGQGYGVALSKSYEVKIGLSGDVKDLHGLFNSALTASRFNAMSRKGCYIGAWIDDGTLYLDVTEIVGDYKQALSLGAKRAQLAIYDFNNNQAINVA
jgi:hypothetical protein